MPWRVTIFMAFVLEVLVWCDIMFGGGGCLPYLKFSPCHIGCLNGSYEFKYSLITKLIT
jgi:hypothetical protein